MDLGKDKAPFYLDMTVFEAGCVIEALATKCVAARNEANDLRYENNGIRDKVREIESRVSGIERMLKREEDGR